MVASAESWEGLRALWIGIKRVLAMFLMGIFGAVVGGFTMAVATFYCYGIGMFLGFPVGLVGGVAMGYRMAPRDTAIVFVGAAAAIPPVLWMGKGQEWDSLSTTFLALTSYSIAGLILLVGVKKFFDARSRSWLAKLLSITFAAATFGWFLWRIYRQ
ncbi:hypothetical protein [Fimbriimonas ginsengisoli]|uniref:Uncharacterized protein n=1 Tax=Fimbriimonas ginsengisoli Gsoil 348 TaxID=661478 RepID=A0A068NJX2_FIMGI|nr:hypothetical protein [Fimbriimonas ginsengisoli]AIE83806.1 hypothetical protein OP10G_0438 [Fimbriimonas ginsengisoli Gsoil 348]